MQNISIDLETFSSVDLTKAGLYKYVQSTDFEILLMAYSLDYAEPEIIDLAQGEIIPDWLNSAIKSPNYIKHAYNAAFEWYCLSKFYGELLPIDQWRDTMLHGLYCGFTAGLGATGKALGLNSDKRKLSIGKSLIKFFCTPHDATDMHEQHQLDLFERDLTKWQQFKDYCVQDVVTEMAIEQKLAAFPVPDEIEQQWQTDLIINSRGVAVDMKLVQGALQIGNETREKLKDEAVKITGLNNPNSVSQLSKWLEAETAENISNLRKDYIVELLNNPNITGVPKRMLEVRRELGKTSTKKYDAIETAACSDNRVRGLLQFYGANRSGRWAGRLVQVQNLPRTYIPNNLLDFAREYVKNNQTDALKFCFGLVNDTLSQLIRTAFIASSGHKLIDADFSSIEARIISWLAGEDWRLEVFRTHGKIYEASASQMFNVPIEKIAKGNPEYSLRQRGKVAELALGYQGGAGALIAMGALKMGISEDDLADIVTRWRKANRKIVKLWHDVENTAIQTVETSEQRTLKNIVFSRKFDPENDLDFLTITLPSGREIFYPSPKLCDTNYANKQSISYLGVNQTTKQWTRLETYGGKLVENIVQAIARDCLAVAIERLEAAGYPIVFHVHDEVVIDCPENRTNLDEVVKLMTEPIPWAQYLPLNADGWIGDYYRKE